MCSSGAALTPVELPEGARQPAQAPSISPDGRWLVTRGHDGIVHLTELSSPDFPNRTLVLRGHEGVAHRHAFSANSRFLATTAGHAIHLWDLAADDPANALMLLRGHQDRVLRMVFSASGTTLITASMDWTVRIWNLRTDTLEASARTLAGRNLTRTEWASYFPEREYRETFPSVERT
jgi:WD40 repeat protein